MEYENQRWMSGANQEDIAQRLLRMLKNASYALPNGYLSLILRVLTVSNIS